MTTSRRPADEPTGRDIAAGTHRAVRAAALAVIRAGIDGPEVLLVRRRRDTAFGGAWAFPGGAVEPIDRAGRAPAAVVAARAAVRELAEETEVIAAADDVVPLLGPVVTTDGDRRFSVWFFAFSADRDIEVRLNAAELTAQQWMTPADALRRSVAGSLRVPPATRAALTVLAGRVDDALTASALGSSTNGRGGRVG